MAKATGGVFDALLETFASDDDKATFQSLAERNPEIKNYGLRQSDYSRLMDEGKSKIEQADKWKKWAEGEWDPEANATKTTVMLRSEVERLAQEKAELESKITLGDGNMTFAELEAHTEKWSKEKGFLTKEELTKKEDDLTKYVREFNALSTKAALEVPYLNQLHQKEFGELFDPVEFINEAGQKGRSNLRELYEEKVAPKRRERLEAEHKATIERLEKESAEKIEANKKQAEEDARKQFAMGQNGQIPTDMDGTNNLGPLQKRMLAPEPVAEGGKAPEVPLGEGGIALYAAREYVNKSVGR